MTRDILDTFIENHDTAGLIDLAKKSVVTLEPVCIPSYKFRQHAKLVRNIQFDGPVYLFVYADDYVESGYSEYSFPQNVEIVKIEKKDFEDLGLVWRGICSKRVYMQHYMEEVVGVKNYYMVDDDVRPIAKYAHAVRNNACKSSIVEDISINDVCKLIKFISVCRPEYRLLGTDKSRIAAQFYNWKDVVKDDKLVLNLFYFNDCPVKFDKENKKDEDYQLYVDCMSKHVKIGTIPFIAIDPQFNDDLSTLPKESKAVNNFLQYPQWCNLTLSRDGKLGSKLILRKIKKNDMSIDDPELVEFCKTNSVEEIKEYLRKKENGN